MTPQTLQLELVTRAVMETLENLAFTELTAEPPSGSGADGSGPPVCRGSIAFEGTGKLSMAIDRDFLSEVTQVLYNQPGEVPEEMLGDALKEILNIVAGRFLCGLLGDERDFLLGLPELSADAAADWTSAPVQCRLRREEGGSLSVYLSAA